LGFRVAEYGLQIFADLQILVADFADFGCKKYSRVYTFF
jgi:hypothetical protein